MPDPSGEVAATVSDAQDAVLAERVEPCPHCQSAKVRPSRRSYPQDREKTGDGAASFWRCGNCGARFIGAQAPWREPKSSTRTSASSPDSTADQRVRLARFLRRWVFPILVILSTIVAVVYLLERRDPPQEQLILPDS